MAAYFIGVDVGTGSARAGVFDAAGTHACFGEGRHPSLARGRRHSRAVEQRHLARGLRKRSRARWRRPASRRARWRGIGFDATCSLVVLGEGGQSSRGRPVRTIPSATSSSGWIIAPPIRPGASTPAPQPVLRYVGGTISPEMETPKLLWLAENMPGTFASAWQFFDLTDFLTWRCTGSLARSVCTVTCKWTYLAHERRWDEAYFRSVGLGALADEQFARIGTEIVPGGTPLGTGLTAQAAAELGLEAGHAGCGRADRCACRRHRHRRRARRPGRCADPHGLCIRHLGLLDDDDPNEPAFVQGVWGPYFSAMVPGLWLNEGGQSAAGAAIDHLVRMHPAAAKPRAWPKSRASASVPGWPNAQPKAWRRRRDRATGGRSCTWCRNFSAIARPSPIRTRRRLSRASGWTPA